jgi:general secretion pathway protein B
MSFILDALKKSDQQRRRGATPTLLTVPAAIAEPRQPAVFIYWIPAAVILGAGILIGWLRPWQPEKGAPAVTTTITAQQTDSSLRQIPAVTPALPETNRRPEPVPPQLAPRIQERLSDAPRKAGPASIPDKRVDAVPAEVAPEQGVVELQELPLSIRRELPEMRIAMHAYSPKPDARLVSINDQLLREGDRAAAGVKLEQITPDGMIFSYKEYRFHRGVR